MHISQTLIVWLCWLGILTVATINIAVIFALH
jgi:hypothetical protein